MGSSYPGLPDAESLKAFRQNIAGQMSWFWYNTPNQFIPAGGPPAESNLVIDAGSDFMMLELMAVSDQDAAVFLNYTIEISASSSGRAFQSNPSHSRLVGGTGIQPHYLAVPILFEAASSIAIRLVALNAAVAYNIRLAFGGVKFYKY